MSDLSTLVALAMHDNRDALADEIAALDRERRGELLIQSLLLAGSAYVGIAEQNDFPVDRMVGLVLDELDEVKDPGS